MSGLLQDVRYALRRLRQRTVSGSSPGHTTSRAHERIYLSYAMCRYLCNRNSESSGLLAHFESR